MVLHVRTSLAGGAVLVAAVLAVFGAPFATILLLVAAVQFGLGWRTGVIPLVLAAPCAILEYPLRIEPLAHQLHDEGLDSLSGRDLASVWLLHLGVAVGGGLAGFPEVARETAGLVVPGPEVRVRASSFPVGAPPVDAVMKTWTTSLRASTDDAVLFRPRVVPVPQQSSLRHALALDPITLSGSAVREGDQWRLDVVGRVPIDYPPAAELELFVTPSGPVRIHEALFDALERRGWLFPYTMEWRWTMLIADPS